MKPRPYVLKESNWKAVSKQTPKVAILPWGATEAHNYHLPYGTDIFETEMIANESARIAWEAGCSCIVLPILPFGVNTTQLDIPMTINMNPSTQLSVVSDIVESLEQQGVEKLVILNGHGGNDFKPIIRELQPNTDLFLCQVAWYAIPPAEGQFDHEGDHANEMETSLMLHMVPELVLPLEEAGEGKSKQAVLRGFREKWAWMPRPWTQVTEDTGVGNPKLATAEKGKQHFELMTQTISEFLVELEKKAPHQLYEKS